MKKEKPAEEKSTGYTTTEVGAMLESIHKEVKLVAEGHSGLDRRLERLEVEVHGNSDRLNMLEVVARVTNGKVSHLENAVSRLGKDLAETKKELKAEIAQTKEELRAEITAAKVELRAEITATKVELKAEITATKVELKNDIHELGDRLTAMESGR